MENNNQEINITERVTLYDVTTQYHSDLKNEDYNASFRAACHIDGRVTITPDSGDARTGLVFYNSDPDVVLAMANMLKAFAEMVKKENAEETENSIDISRNV